MIHDQLNKVNIFSDFITFCSESDISFINWLHMLIDGMVVSTVFCNICSFFCSADSCDDKT